MVAKPAGAAQTAGMALTTCSATAIMPAQEPAVSSDFFQGGVPATNTPATTISVDWLNGINAELLNLVTAAGLTPTKATLTQVTSAVKALGKTGPGLQNLYFSTPVSMTGGSTVLIGPSGVSTSDLGSRWIIPFTTGTIVGVYLSASAAPAGVPWGARARWLRARCRKSGLP